MCEKIGSFTLLVGLLALAALILIEMKCEKMSPLTSPTISCPPFEEHSMARM